MTITIVGFVVELHKQDNFGGSNNISLSSKKKQRKTKTTHKAIAKEVLVAAVVDQIQLDIEKKETEAVVLLVTYIPSAILLSFLPDDYLDKEVMI